MKNRDYKNFIENEYFHIYNRGVGKMNIFLDDQDKSVFMSRLHENIYPEKAKLEINIGGKKKKIERKLLPSNSFELVSFCLMPNHFHLLIKQLTNLPISKLVSKICTSYSMYFNKKYGRVGSLFQDAFKAVQIETNQQLLWLSLYIHENPSKAGIVENLEKYKWSSFLEYIGLSKGICKKDIILGQYKNRSEYLSHFKNLKEKEQVQNNLIGIQDLLIDDDN